MSIKHIVLTIFALLILSNKVCAAFLIDTEFYFGKISVTDNTIISSVQISRTGRATATGKLYILEVGQPGVYSLTELPPYVVVSLSANLPAFSTSAIPGTQQFNISAVDMPDTVNADFSGTIQFTVGGVLQTSGAGGTYIGPADYQILSDIDISY